MADSTQLFIDIQTNMLKTLQSSQKSLDKMGDILTENQKKFDTIDKTGEKILDSYSDIDKHQKSWNKGLSATDKIMNGIKNSITSLAQVAGGLFAAFSVGGAFKDALQINEDMIDLSFRMGQSGKSVRQLRDAVHETTQAVGISIDKASQLVQELGRLRVPTEQIQKLAITTARFEKITGVSTQTASRLTGELSRVGKLGAPAIQSVMLTMTKMQRAVGLTEGEMEELSQTTVKTTQLLHQMGKSRQDIEKFAKGTSVLAAAFSSVGNTASEALRVVEDLLDPSRVEDNAFMLSKLGVSLDDAFSGNVDPGMLASRFKDLGQELKSMSGPAAAEMAKSLGMPLSTLRQMADLDMGKLEKALQETGGDAEAAMKKMQAEQAGPQEQIEDSVNKLQGMLVETMGKLVDVLSQITKYLPAFMDGVKKVFDFISSKMNWIFIGLVVAGIVALTKLKKKFFETNTEVSNNLEFGMVKAIEMGNEKGNIKSLARQKSYSQAWSEDRKKRVMETYAFQAKQEKGEYLESLANTNTYFKSIINWSAQVTKQAAFGVKGNSYWLTVADSLNKKASERYQINKMELDQTIRLKQEELEGLNNYKKRFEDRRNELLLMKEQGGLTAAQTSEFNNINKSIEKMNKKEFNINKTLEERKLLSELQNKKMLETLSVDELGKMRERVMLDKASAQDKIKNLAITKKSIKEEQLANSKIQEALQSQKLLLQSKKQLSVEEAIQLAKINEELSRSKNIGEALNSELAQTDTEIEKSVIEAKKLNDQQKQLEAVGSGRVFKADKNAMKEQMGFVHRLSLAGKAFKKDLISGATQMGNKVQKSFINAKESLVEGIKNAGPYLKQLGGLGPLGVVKGIGKVITTKGTGKFDDDGQEIRVKRFAKGAGGIGGAAAGALGLIVGMLMKSEKFQQIMQKIMAAIQKPIDMLFKAIEPLIDPLLNLIETFFMKLFMPIIKAVAPILIQGIGMMLTILGGILQGIGHIVKFLTKNSTLLDLGVSISEAGAKFAKTQLDFSDKLSDNTEALEKSTEEGPAVYSATGSGLSLSSAASKVVPSSPEEKRQQELQEKSTKATTQTATSTEDLSRKQDKLIALQETMASILLEIKKLTASSLAVLSIEKEGK